MDRHDSLSLGAPSSPGKPNSCRRLSLLGWDIVAMTCVTTQCSVTSCCPESSLLSCVEPPCTGWRQAGENIQPNNSAAPRTNQLLGQSSSGDRLTKKILPNNSATSRSRPHLSLHWCRYVTRSELSVQKIALSRQTRRRPFFTAETCPVTGDGDTARHVNFEKLTTQVRVWSILFFL